ncbi:MAG: tRNA (adenosine(37)-N6)-threonylcarbamoyltransferase complex ATPase subunit type 1 TsaE [Bacteroidales bacterium]|nr:MAG: tRNA (adenosine(37)-N6)-threonylcarbamoyltransferase complex ATPase subunit type 1 TsaE [Bacteroidales bacterium]
MKKIKIPSVKHLKEAAVILLKSYGNHRIFALYGELGSGKTALVQAICRELGMTDMVNSPSFPLVNEYRSGNNRIVYHFDFYRIKNLEEVYDLGYEDYFYSGNYCFIEWPEKIEQLLPAGTIPVKIEVDARKERILWIDSPIPDS